MYLTSSSDCILCYQVNETRLNDDCTESWTCATPMELTMQYVVCPFMEGSTCTDAVCHCDDYEQTGCESESLKLYYCYMLYGNLPTACNEAIY